MTTAIIQCAESDEFKNLLKRLEPYYVKLCAKFGYTYYPTYTPEPNTHIHWMKHYLFKKAYSEGATKVVWLDIDTLWLGNEFSAFNLLSPKKPIGMTHHHHPEFGHYNAGVMFTIASPIDYLTMWKSKSHLENDQIAINEFPELIVKLPHKYNSVQWIPQYSEPNPEIIAWHGCPNRYNIMLNFFNDYGL